MNYSKWSAWLSVIAAIVLLLSYVIAPATPEGILVIIIAVLYFGAMIVALVSIVLSMLAFKNKEAGFLKFVAPLVVFLVLVIYIIVFMLMGYGLISGP